MVDFFMTKFYGFAFPLGLILFVLWIKGVPSAPHEHHGPQGQHKAFEENRAFLEE